MEVKTQTVEQFLFEQLEKVAPGKYTLAGVLQLFKSQLRFNCNHLKGGGRSRSLGTFGKDYNLSIFTFPNGVTEVKCLYNCGLKICSDQKELTSAFNEAYDLPSSNTKASAEERYSVKGGKRVPVDPGPAPVYSDAYRQRVRESADIFLSVLKTGLECGRIKPSDPILGGILPHPDPKEAPESAVERGLKTAYVKAKKNKLIRTATAVVQDSVPVLEPVKKIRKTQSRKRGK